MRAFINGKGYWSWKLAAKSHGISYETFVSRVHNQGWDRARAATEPLKQRPIFQVNNQAMTTTDIAEIAGLTMNAISHRIRRGMSPEDAMQPRMRPLNGGPNLELKKLRAKQRHNKHRDAVRQYKLSKQCHDCAGVFSASQLEFDHCRGPKHFELSRSGSKSLHTIATEIAKCDVVCANCHRLRHHKVMTTTPA